MILFDANLVSNVDHDWFDPGRWQEADPEGAAQAGRGQVTYFDAPFGGCVLRHYLRGGLVARINADKYVWSGRERTRGFREFRLLAHLHDAGLRVPAPVAARYVRHGLYYRADLITHRIPAACTLAQHLAARDLDAALGARVGRVLAGFHAAGAWHADLNAHNVLTDGSGNVWLLDFDRGRLRKPAMDWQQANLARLQRSFVKLGARKKITDFDQCFWHPLLAAYHRALADRVTQQGSQA